MAGPPLPQSDEPDRAATGVSALARWPFWAPTPPEAIEHALDLAEVSPGCRLLDLGCGDGRVLEAAARRGAFVTGYEASPEFAKEARSRLEHLDGPVRIIEADFHRAPLDADVVFAFLSPATLFRLRGRLAALPPGTRIVTYGYGVVGWQPTRTSNGCFLYTLPVRGTGAAVVGGWRDAGLVSVCPPGRTVLQALLFGAEPGALELEISTTLSSKAEVYPGGFRTLQRQNIPIDVKFTGGKEGDLTFGGLRAQGKEVLIWCLVTGDEVVAHRLDAGSLELLKQRYRRIRDGQLPASALVEGLAPADS